MGAEQAAGTMAIVMEASARDRGLEPDRAQIDGMRAKIIETFDRQTSSFYTSGRLLDDGIIDPRDTRQVLTQVLQLFRRADGLPLRPLSFGVARP
jgi:geranyl-CoA carboxylase beta subunit